MPWGILSNPPDNAALTCALDARMRDSKGALGELVRNAGMRSDCGVWCRLMSATCYASVQRLADADLPAEHAWLPRGVVEASASTRISLMWTVEARSQELSFLEACPGQSKLTVLLPGATKGRASAGNGRGILGQKALHPERLRASPYTGTVQPFGMGMLISRRSRGGGG